MEGSSRAARSACDAQPLDAGTQSAHTNAQLYLFRHDRVNPDPARTASCAPQHGSRCSRESGVPTMIPTAASPAHDPSVRGHDDGTTRHSKENVHVNDDILGRRVRSETRDPAHGVG
ncbi:hypothetical protein GCM10022230_00640 [Pseudoclavibacter caeni]